eukprot:gene18489-28535_t
MGDASSGIQQAAVLFGAGTLRGVVEGTDEEAAEAVGRVVELLAGCAEVGACVLLKTQVEPVDRKAVLHAAVALTKLAMQRDTADGEVFPPGITLGRAIIECSPLTKRLQKDTQQKMMANLIAPCIRGPTGEVRTVPSTVLHFVKHIAKCTPGRGPDVLSSVISALLEQITPKTTPCVGALIAHLIATHGMEFSEADLPDKNASFKTDASTFVAQGPAAKLPRANSGRRAGGVGDRKFESGLVAEILQFLDPSTLEGSGGGKPSEGTRGALAEACGLVCRAVAYKEGRRALEHLNYTGPSLRLDDFNDILRATSCYFPAPTPPAPATTAGAGSKTRGNGPSPSSALPTGKTPQPPGDAKGAAAVTLQMLLKGQPKAGGGGGGVDDDEGKLAKRAAAMTHVNLEGRSLASLAGVHRCDSLRVLYVDLNCLRGFGSWLCPLAGTLTHLYANSNEITTLEGLAALRNLKKLYVRRNRLRSLAGIENLTSLEELHASHQQPAESDEAAENPAHTPSPPREQTPQHVAFEEPRPPPTSDSDCASAPSRCDRTSFDLSVADTPGAPGAGRKPRPVMNEEEAAAFGLRSPMIAPAQAAEPAQGRKSVFEKLRKLKVLKLAGVGLRDEQLQHVGAGGALEDADLSENALVDAGCVVAALHRCARLRVLQLAGNPAARAAKFRDRLVAVCPGLADFDGSAVTGRERAFIDHIDRRKAAPKKPAKPASSGVTTLPLLGLTGTAPARTNSAPLL